MQPQDEAGTGPCVARRAELRHFESLPQETKDAAYGWVTQWLLKEIFGMQQSEPADRKGRGVVRGVGSGLLVGSGLAVGGLITAPLVLGAVAAVGGALGYQQATGQADGSYVFPTLRESGAGECEPMVRLLQLAPRLVAAGDQAAAWVVALCEGGPALAKAVTEDWYSVHWGTRLRNLAAARSAYSGRDPLQSLAPLLAAARAVDNRRLQPGEPVSSSCQGLSLLMCVLDSRA